MIYAEINNENICYAISDMGNIAVEKPTLIELNTFDTSIVGKKYNNGVWEEVPQPEPEPSQLDRIETLLNTSYTDAQNAAVDAYTEELIEGGIL